MTLLQRRTVAPVKVTSMLSYLGLVVASQKPPGTCCEMDTVGVFRPATQADRLVLPVNVAVVTPVAPYWAGRAPWLSTVVGLMAVGAVHTSATGLPELGAR